MDEVLVLPEFFPADLLDALIVDLDGSAERKREFALVDASAPQCAVIAAELVASRLGLEFNLGLLKWYRESDPEPSAAYAWHVDPEHLRSIPLVLCTLKGSATLSYQLPGAPVRTVLCGPNVVVVIPADAPHAVTPPHGDGERNHHFQGWNSQLAA